MTSIPVQKGPVAPPPAATVVVERSENPVFAGMQRSMEDELEKRKKNWEQDVDKMQQEFFQIKKPSEENEVARINGPGGSEIIGIKNSKSIYSDGPDGTQVFRHRFDMHGFNPEDINVSVDGRRITVTGRLTEEKGGHKSTRNFNRQVDVPRDVDPDKLTSFFSDEGILTVEAPVEPREEEEDQQNAYLEYGLEPGSEVVYSGSGYGVGLDGSQFIPAGSGGYSYYRSGYSGGVDPPGYHMVRTVQTSSSGHQPGGRQVEIRASDPRKVVVRSRPTRNHSPPNVFYRSQSPKIIHETHRSVSPGVSRREVHYSSGGFPSSSSTRVYHSSSPTTHIYGSTSPSHFLSTSPTALLSSSPNAKTTYYHSSSSGSSLSPHATNTGLSLKTTTTNKPLTNSGLSIGRFSQPMIVNLPNSKKFKLGVDLGTGYEAPEVTVKLDGNKIHVKAKHEEITEGRTSNREFSREFDVPESIEANTLRASLDSEGRLVIGASISANKNHVEALNSIMNDMPPDAEPCRIEI